MPSPRKAFANKLNANRMKNGQLSNEQKGCIISARLNGEKPSVLAARYSCHRNTITKLFNRYSRTSTTTPQPRIGRPPLLNRRERRALFRHIRKDPTCSYATLVQWCNDSFDKKPSKKTIRRILQSTGLKHWKSLRRIYLNPKAVLQRNRYHREWRGKEVELTCVCSFIV
jgi:transposase